MHLKVGALLQGGKYRIESVLGQGGFGITYLAVQTGLNRKVAIKEFFMKDICERDADTSHVSVPSSGSRELVEKFRIKFIKEAQTIASLSHPNIIRIHDIFEENGTAYYVMEYHGAGSVADMDLPMPADKALCYVRQISSALDYLHSRSVMHLDVKPSNVLIDDASNAVLIDFGVSKRYDESGHQTSSTPIGISHGYAPIEQYSQSTLTFSPATDIYALGATLYKLLTGETPPEASILVSNPSALNFPPFVPHPLSSVIRKCMDVVIANRPQSIDEFLALLDGCELTPMAVPVQKSVAEPEEGMVQEPIEENNEATQLNVSVPGPKSPLPPSDPAPRKRRPWLWLLLLALVAGVVCAVMFSGRTTADEEVSVNQPVVPETPMTPESPNQKGSIARNKTEEERLAKEEENSRFESDYKKYRNDMELGAEYEKTESTLSQSQAKYESAQKIEKSWSDNGKYSFRFDLNASAALKRVRDRIEQIDNEQKKQKEEAARKKAERQAVKDLGRSANCYIVSSSGKYKFKTVKGNSKESVGQVALAEVLWESFGTDVKPKVGDLIQKVSYLDGYIAFETANVFREGNAVIAAKDANGKILWSWHIWLTDAPQKQEYFNNAGTMMDRNLGATSATPGDVGALGLLYQWGRKDPFLGSSSIIDEIAAKSTISWPSAVESNSSNGTIAYATAHPTTFITYNNENRDWYYTGTKDTDNTRWTTSDKTKSIYDPCPSGWRVPDGGSNGVWSKALGSSSDFEQEYSSSNRGMNFSGKFGSASTIWYPASGYRYYDVGSLGSVGSGGYCWSASPFSYTAYYLYFKGKGKVGPSGNSNRAFGRSVRCLQE